MKYDDFDALITKSRDVYQLHDFETMKYFVLVAVGILTLSQEIFLIRVSQTTGEVSTIRIRLNFLKIVTQINQMLAMFNTTRAFKNCLAIFLFAFVEFLNSGKNFICI